MENSVPRNLVSESGQWISDKKEPELHGYGMQNIRDIVEKYEGDFSCDVDHKHFIASISIYDM